MSDLDDYYQRAALPKPIPRKRLKARAKREKRDKTAEVREYVFTREQNICRCCRRRPAKSMHEMVPRSRGGRVSKRNSIAVCGALGNDTAYCHGLLQTSQIVLSFGMLGAEGLIVFEPRTAMAADRMHLPIYTRLESGPTPQIRGESE